MGYRTLATAILAVHFAYLLYVVFGGFVAWRWPRTIWLHLLAAAWGLLIITALVDCPLTFAENWARTRAGLAAESRGFIDRYIEGVLYPERYTGLMQAVAAAAVLVSYIGFAVAWRRRAAKVRAAQSERPPVAPSSR